MPHRQRAVSLVMAFVVAGALLACGGGSSGAPSAGGAGGSGAPGGTGGAGGTGGTGGSGGAEVTLAGLTISPGNPRLVLSTATQVQLRATARFSDDTTRDRTDHVAWISSDPTVVSVSNAAGARGLAASGTAAGTATITATDGETGATASIAVVVTEAVVSTLAVEPAAVAVPVGYGVQLTAWATYSDTGAEPPLDVTDLVEWISSDAQIAAISNDPVTRGVVTALARGETTITARIPGGTSATAALTVTEAVLHSITVEPIGAQSDRIPIGFPVQLRAWGSFSDGTLQDVTGFVSWTASDGSVAEISNAPGSVGVVTGRAVGPAKVTATGGSVTGSIDLDFTGAALLSMTVGASPGRPWTWSGTITRFSAEGRFSDGSVLDLTREVTWSASPEVGSFSSVPGKESHLLATTPTPNPVTITATAAGSEVTDTFQWDRGVRPRSR